MGEARQRGTRDERKAQAIAAGRVKRKPQRSFIQHHSDTMKGVGMALLAMARSKVKRHQTRK